jgi:hypothetical protein
VESSRLSQLKGSPHINKDAVCYGVTHIHALAGPAQANNQKSEIKNQKCQDRPGVEPAASSQKLEALASEIKNQKCESVPGQPAKPRPTFLELAGSEGYVRLRGLYNKLQMKGRNPNLLNLFQTHTSQNLRAKLDWVAAHPEWCANLRGRQAKDFLNAFDQLVIPC